MNYAKTPKSMMRRNLWRSCYAMLASLAILGVARPGHALPVSPVTGSSTDPNVDPTVSGNQAETICNVSVVNGASVESVAFNDDEPSSLMQYTATNRTVFPGYSGQGWSFRARTAANPNPPWTHSLLPTPAGWDLLWGDPSLASNPGLPNVAFLGTLAVPHAKFLYVSNQNGTPGSLQGAFTDSPSPLGGACIARSTDGGETFSVVGCVQDTTDVGNLGDTLGHFYDGSSMAVTQNGSGGFSAFAAFIDTETHREAIWSMPDVTSNAANPFQPDNTLMGKIGALPDDSLGPIETHVRLRASGADLWKMSISTANILQLNIRDRNGNAVGLASDVVVGMAADFGNDATGTDITVRTGPEFAFDIGVNEQNAPEMRFVYIAATASQTANFHLQGGFCPLNDLTQCTTVAQWTTQPQSVPMTLFPAIKFALDPVSNQPVWKVTFQGRTPQNTGQLAVFAADLVRPDMVAPSPTYNTAGLVVAQITPFQTPCPDIREPGTDLGFGYWGDYDDMTFDPTTGTFVRSFTDSTLGCNLPRERFTSHNVHVSTVEIPPGPQATVALSGIEFGTTGTNFCSGGCNCPHNVPDVTVTCVPVPNLAGGFTQGVTQQPLGGCSDSHGALVTVTCIPGADSGIDVTVTFELEQSCNDLGSAQQPDQGFNAGTAMDVLPGQQQQIGPLGACNGFGSTCGSGNACTFNSITVASITVLNTGG